MTLFGREIHFRGRRRHRRRGRRWAQEPATGLTLADVPAGNRVPGPGIEYLRGRLAERRRSALLRDYASAVARDLLGPLREAALENR